MDVVGDDNVRRYAIIRNGVVDNVILAGDKWNFAPEVEYVDVTDLSVGPGFIYDGNSFIAPSSSDENEESLSED